MFWIGRSGAVAFIVVTVLAFPSCRRGAPRIEQPGFDASAAGSGAMEIYDANSDGKVAGEELEKAPSLKAALVRLDTNKDGGVSAEEVEARVNAWKAMETAQTSIRCQITLDGQPLPAARIVFEPESFLGDEIKTASAISTVYGEAAPVIAPEDRPTKNFPGGIHLGLYKVQISKLDNGKETLPSRYNSESTLGAEVSNDNPAADKGFVFALESK
jgi:hypothetical protein